MRGTTATAVQGGVHQAIRLVQPTVPRTVLCQVGAVRALLLAWRRDALERAAAHADGVAAAQGGAHGAPAFAAVAALSPVQPTRASGRQGGGLRCGFLPLPVLLI